MADLSLLLEFYENLVKSRRFDELLWDAYVNGKPLGMTHLGMGEEAVGTGSMKVFRDTDIVCPHHRAHPHLLMRGCDLKSMLSETLLKATGTCMGKAGEAHFMDVSKNCYVIGGTLGPCFTVPLGFAYNFKHEGKGNIAVAYTGDGCTQEGPFFEALNYAKAFRLPVLFIIQNNHFAISEDFRQMSGLQQLSQRGAGFGIPYETVENGNDVELVYEATKAATAYVREGHGPYLIEFKTWRKMGHGPNESGTKYKDPEEQKKWLAKDPIDLLTKKLKEQYQVPEEQLQQIRDKVEAELKEAWEYAEAAPYADVSVAMQHIYAGC